MCHDLNRLCHTITMYHIWASIILRPFIRGNFGIWCKMNVKFTTIQSQVALSLQRKPPVLCKNNTAAAVAISGSYYSSRNALSLAEELISILSMPLIRSTEWDSYEKKSLFIFQLLGECHCWWTSESPRAHVAKFYGWLLLIRSVWEHKKLFD